MDHKIVSLLGLARRAGKAVLGYDQIQKRPRIFRVLVAASDVSDRSAIGSNGVDFVYKKRTRR